LLGQFARFFKILKSAVFSYRNENEALRLPCVKISVYRNESENWSRVFRFHREKKERCKGGDLFCVLAELLSASKCGNEVRYEKVL